jgi:nucleoside-diphosphate-sugar epimerase
MTDIIGVSGTSGFVGSSLIKCFSHREFTCVRLQREVSNAAYTQSIGPLDGSPISPAALTGCTVVIHAAARAHILNEADPAPLAAFRRANTAATLRLAEASIAAGVRRFVFISSIGVLGNHSTGQALRPSDLVSPIEDYARSKAEAEAGLRALCEQAGMELVIVRPPLVHGPGAKGNFQRLMAAIYAGKRLPLGGVENRRSFVGVKNLADALLLAATVPLSLGRGAIIPAMRAGGARPQVSQTLPLQAEACAPRVYHLADDGVISTRWLVEVLAEGMGVQPRLINVPRWLAVGGATLLGKGAMARRLFDDLEVDDVDFRRDFGWRPAIGLEDGLRMMAADFAKRMRDERNLPMGLY